MKYDFLHHRIFAEVGKGDKMFDEEIKSALYKRAVGFESDEIIEEYSCDENGKPVLSKRKITKKFNAPDISALKFLLEKNELDEQEYANMTDEQLIKEKERLLQLLKEKDFF